MVFAKLLFYFSFNVLQVALPLGVLISSLMTFGNLGEHFELTAIKSAGISLVRALRPVFFLVVLIAIGAFFINNYAIPVANLNAYSLLYDIKHKKPALDIQEGVFYYGLPNYVIKVKEKLPDDITLKGVIIYDHSGTQGNKQVILADSSKMSLFMDDRYLKLELFNGNYYKEIQKIGHQVDQFHRTKYSRMNIVFSLASFKLDTTDQRLFQHNRHMKNIFQLTDDIDSMQTQIDEIKSSFDQKALRYFAYFKEDYREKQHLEGIKKQDPIRKDVGLAAHLKNESKIVDRKSELKTEPPAVQKSLKRTKIDQKNVSKLDTLSLTNLDSILIKKNTPLDAITKSARTQSRNIQNTLNLMQSKISSTKRERNKYVVSKFRILSQAVASIVMFLIGAPLGAIIKKGGMGVPVIISIFFFIAYYVMVVLGQKYAVEGIMNGMYSVWMADMILLPFGLFFVRQARIDARLFDVDVYIIWWDRFITRLRQKRKNW